VVVDCSTGLIDRRAHKQLRGSFALKKGLEASVHLRRIRNFCAEFGQNGPIATLSKRNEAPLDTIAFPVPTSLFRANEPTIDLHIFASRSFNVEETFESGSRVRAIEFSDSPGSRGGLGDVVDEEARHAVFNDFWR
jgi:hypothetical protein